MSDKTREYLCELCAESVKSNELHVRIGADSVTRTDVGDDLSAIGNQLMVFAVFHNECVHATAERADCDEVQYIWLARQLVDEIENRKMISITPRKEPLIKRPAFTLLQGGLSA